MQRHSAFTLSLFFLCCLASPVAAVAQENLPALIKRVQSAVVTVVAYDEKGQAIQQGSGFFINKSGHLLTNRHVLHSAFRAEVKTREERTYPITQVVAEDRDGDLLRVVVTIPEDAVQTLAIATTLPDVGEQVIVVGSPLGLEQTASDGIVSAVRDIPGVGKILQITAPISPGSSGSPVVNLRGEVIGVATLQMKQGQNLNFAIPAERVLTLKLQKGQPLAGWTEETVKDWNAAARELFDKGRDLARKNAFEEALSYFEQVAQHPGDLGDGVWVYIGLCKNGLGRHQEAIEAFKQAIRLDSSFPNLPAHEGLGDSYAALGRRQEAIAAYMKGLESEQALYIFSDSDATSSTSHFLLGIGSASLGDKLFAISAYTQALEAYTQATEAYKQAIRLEPTFARAHKGLADAYTMLGGIHLLQHSNRSVHDAACTQALEAYKQAIRLEPDDAEAHDGLSVAYGELGRHQEAIEASKQAIRLKPDYARAHFHLGFEYLILGDRGSALEEYKILKGLDQELANLLFKIIYE